ncbi:biotin-dependent carboxyltransferase family protein [Marinomonas sp. THO17]|uniref:5-oxoprolinase subunit C family protein n=1 Tax=Marinomonas sp. THO17 TaxID=3149048 RepID=UPI00336C13B1
MAFKVIKPGMLTLLQDLGRYGHQAIGVTTGGPMDELAFRWANALLDNDDNAQQLEITFGLLSLEAQANTSIALTGADLGATLNGKSLTPWQSYAVKKGDVLNFQQPIWGLRAYLAVKGGFQCETTLGSVATVMREKIGGLTGQGDKLQKDDILPFQASDQHQQRAVPRAAIPDYSQSDIPLVLGYQYLSFSDLQRAHFFSSDYKVSQNSDRMGYRLEGNAIQGNAKGIISEGIAYGSVQIPKDGQPIVLLRDRQTIGGYPKMGCITRFGGALLAQKKPGDVIQFTPISIDQAEQERHLQMARLQQWR